VGKVERFVMVEKLEKERKIRNFTEVKKLDVYKV
jgi:hypothetical protein